MAGVYAAAVVKQREQTHGARMDIQANRKRRSVPKDPRLMGRAVDAAGCEAESSARFGSNAAHDGRAAGCARRWFGQ